MKDVIYLLFHLLTGNPWHDLYDYEEVVQRHNLPLDLESRRLERAYGLPLFETLVWTHR